MTDKTERQDKIALDLYNNKGGIIYGATGVGKSRIIIEALRRFDQASTVPLKFFWVVPEINLRDVEVYNELKEWEFESKHRKMIIIPVCYRSLADEYYKVDGVILDELQHITEDNCAAILANRPEVLIAATASKPNRQDKKDLIVQLGLKVIADIPLSEARDKKYVNDFELFVYRIEMDKSNRYLKPFKNQKYPRTELEAYTDIQNLMNKIRHETGAMPPPWLLLKRKRFVQDLKSKEEFVIRLVKKLEKEKIRFIHFCASQDQADRLNPNSYHSNNKSDAEADFNGGFIDSFSCVRAIDEGHNIVNVQAILIMNLDKEERTFIQRIGRGIRWREDGIPTKVYLIISKNTMEEKWLAGIIKKENLDEGKIYYYDF